MPSIRKRIGYLPSINAHETITKIANKENLSQSKVVGILVEEALIARDELNFKKSINNTPYREKSSLEKLSLKYNDFDELISDKGIIYNTKKSINNTEKNSPEPTEKYNKELFEQFKQFIIFQNMIQKN